MMTAMNDLTAPTTPKDARRALLARDDILLVMRPAQPGATPSPGCVSAHSVCDEVPPGLAQPASGEQRDGVGRTARIGGGSRTARPACAGVFPTLGAVKHAFVANTRRNVVAYRWCWCGAMPTLRSCSPFTGTGRGSVSISC